MPATCPFCRQVVEPLVGPGGVRTCPACANTGQPTAGRATMEAPAGLSVGAAASVPQQTLVRAPAAPSGHAAPAYAPHAYGAMPPPPDAAYAAGYHAAMLQMGGLTALEKRSKHATQEGILSIVLGPIGVLFGFLAAVGIACGITGWVRSANLLRETQGAVPHLHAKARTSRTTSIVGTALSVAGLAGNVLFLLHVMG